MGASVKQLADAKARAARLTTKAYPSRAETPLECDLVMKGGITSGVVYPLAACELADTYRFCNLGGSSAGALAAAAVAAAEYGRDTDGFQRLATVPDEIGTSLPRLFKPGPHTATAHQVLMQWLDVEVTTPRKVLRVWRTLLRSQAAAFWVAFAAGVAVAVLVAYLGAGSGRLASFLFLLILMVVLAKLVASGWALYRELRSTWSGLSKQGFGICVGSAPPGTGPPSGDDPGYLTDWLAEKIDEVAGLDRPLTFGDLEERGITLRVMTTNLTHGRPLVFPFASSVFMFEPDELAAYFPPAVMAQLQRDNPQADHDGTPLTTPEGKPLYRLPTPDDLPVVMAARISLSFPALISAVPLWAIDFSRKRTADQRPVRCWFSDGGITSNFPLHLFDALWPRRPTFAIDLRSYHIDHKDDDVYYGGRHNRVTRAKTIDSPAAFASAILDTMQYWADNEQAELPGFRDRIVELHLHDNEGGINLTMDADTIAVLAAKGALAAEAIAAGFEFEPHRSRRFAASIAHVQQAAGDLGPLYRAPGGYRELIGTKPAAGRGGNPWDPAEARAWADELVDLGVKRPPDFGDFSPRPRGKLRIMPEP